MICHAHIDNKNTLPIQPAQTERDNHGFKKISENSSDCSPHCWKSVHVSISWDANLLYSVTRPSDLVSHNFCQSFCHCSSCSGATSLVLPAYIAFVSYTVGSVLGLIHILTEPRRPRKWILVVIVSFTMLHANLSSRPTKFNSFTAL